MDKIQISIIVPVYNVQGYLRQCLESIISQDLGSYEVIMVEDVSTDGSIKIVDEYEKKYVNFRSIRLKKNHGLGNARNIGIDNAKGEYIAFVDSDDYLEPNALSKTLSVATKWNCDIVIMNYSRVWFWGKRVVNSTTPLLKELEPFVEGDENKARLFDVFIVAWNKIYRTDFIRSNSLRNADGFYEDIPWSYPAIMMARRIGVVTDLCYSYRQRPGSILNSTDTRHLDLLKRYEEVLCSQKSILSSSGVLKNKLLDRILDHYLQLLFRKSYRLPKHKQIELFVQSFDQLKIHFSRKEILESEERISFNRILFSVFYYQWGLIYKIYAAINSFLINNKNKFSIIYKLCVDKLFFINFLIYRFVFYKFPINKKKAVFSSYFGDQYSCNPKYISEKLAELDPSFSIFWEVKEKDFDVPQYVKKIRKGSLAYFYHVATAKFFINNVNFSDFLKKRKNTIHIQTQHGTPVKSMGFDMLSNFPAASQMDWKGLERRSSRWDYCISSNSYSSEIWYRSFPYRYKMVECGYPRNDILFTNNPEKTAKIKRNVGVSREKKIILYVPTFREYKNNYDFPFNLNSIEKSLGKEYLFLFRSHHLSSGINVQFDSHMDSFLIDVTTYPDVQELLLITDILITDYSSIMFDFAILNKPIINFIDDYEIYKKVRGMYFDIRKEGPGLVVSDTEKLIEAILMEKYKREDNKEKYEIFRKRFCEFESGNASEFITRNIILGNI